MPNLVVGSIILFSCNQEDVNPIDDVNFKDINHLEFDPSEIKTEFNKEVKIEDESGKYYVIANLGSEQAGAIEENLKFTNYVLHMTYPGELKREQSQLANEQKNPEKNGRGEIKMLFKELYLDQKANGFSIEIKHDIEKIPEARLAYSYTIDYDSPNRWMYWGMVQYQHTSNENPDIRVDWYYRTCSTCSMAYDWGETLHALYFSSVYNKSGARRIRAKVMSNWLNYRVYFKKWEADPWVQVY